MTTKSSIIASSTTPSKTKRRRLGFTLIELLVVIFIIALLVALAFPIYTTVINKANATDAASMVNQIRVALNSYQNDYGDWPPAVLTNATTNAFGNSVLIASTNQSPATNVQVWGSLYSTLTCSGALATTAFLGSNNSRRTVYMQIATKYLSNPTSPTNSTTFYDPWKREYNVEVDATGTNIISGLPLTTQTTINTNMTINAPLAIWSYGSTPSNPAQYIISWK